MLKDVRHVPDICLNLISTGILEDEDSQILLVKVNGSSSKAL